MALQGAGILARVGLPYFDVCLFRCSVNLSSMNVVGNRQDVLFMCLCHPELDAHRHLDVGRVGVIMKNENSVQFFVKNSCVALSFSPTRRVVFTKPEVQSTWQRLLDHLQREISNLDFAGRHEGSFCEPKERSFIVQRRSLGTSKWCPERLPLACSLLSDGSLSPSELNLLKTN